MARAELDTAEKALQDTVLQASFTGVVTQVPFRERESIAAGQFVAAVFGQRPSGYKPRDPKTKDNLIAARYTPRGFRRT